MSTLIDILLINPIERDFFPPSIPPLGLVSIATYLTKNNFAIEIFDINTDREDWEKKLINRIIELNVKIIGLTSIITQYQQIKKIVTLIKNFSNDIFVILGGTGPTSIPEVYLRNIKADVICIGESEITIIELMQIIKNKKSFENCNGLAFLNKNNEITYTPPRKFIMDINKLPFPDWTLLNNIDAYINNYLFSYNLKRGISILSTRGCPGKCSYCLCNFGNKFRMRSINNIFMEIKVLADKFNIEHIHFIDDTFITTEKKIRDLSNRLKTDYKNLITWSANARIDFLNEKKIKLISESNCYSLAFGIESGSDKILKSMNKGFTSAMAERIINLTRKYNIKFKCYFIIGMPGENKETLEETIDFCKRNLVGGEFFFATPLPGTELYRYAKDKGIIKYENLYLEHVGEIRNFLVNLTEMSNEELFNLKERAEIEIKAHLIKNNILVPKSVKENPFETQKKIPLKF